MSADRLTRRSLLVGAGSALLASGCRRSSGRGQALRYPVTLEPATLDPTQVTEGGTGDVLQNIYEGLVAYDEKNQLVPILAQGWTVGDNGRSYTFWLREGVRFHNGRLLTSADVKYSLERALWAETKAPAAPNYLPGVVGLADVVSGKTRELRGVTTPDAHTVVISLDRPRAYFLGALTYYTNYVVCREAIESSGGKVDEKSAIGTGLFKLKERRYGSGVKLEAFQSHHGGRPALERIDRPVVIDPATRHSMYENGEVDLTGISASDYFRDQNDAKLRAELVDAPLASVTYLCMHPRLQPAFRDPRVRKAFAMALDRDEIVRVASQGLWQRADGLLPPGMLGHDPNLPHMPYDLAAAKRLLAEAGYPDGAHFPELTLDHPQGVPERAAAAQIIRERLKTGLGISISLREREAALFVSDRRKEKMAFYIGVWDSDYLDPQNTLSTLLRSGVTLNHFGYHNPTFDKLCDEADGETDARKRAELYREADRLAAQDIALLPLAFNHTRMLVKPYVRGIAQNLMGMLPHQRTTVTRSGA